MYDKETCEEEEEEHLDIDLHELEKDKRAKRVDRNKKDKNQRKNKWQDGGRRPKNQRRNRNDEHATLRDLVNQYR